MREKDPAGTLMTPAVHSAAPHRLVHQFAQHPQRRPFTQINTCSVGEFFLFLFIYFFKLSASRPVSQTKTQDRGGR